MANYFIVAKKYFRLSHEKGFEKSKKFLISYVEMTGSNGFDALEDEIQLLFISQMIKNASFVKPNCFT